MYLIKEFIQRLIIFSIVDVDNEYNNEAVWYSFIISYIRKVEAVKLLTTA